LLEIANEITVLKEEGFCCRTASTTYNKEVASRRVNTVFELLKINAMYINNTIEFYAVKKAKRQLESDNVVSISNNH
tara:strand:- start:63 stop:293 length:231 start_codon:yes stop_codon:yes gene_type:complete